MLDNAYISFENTRYNLFLFNIFLQKDERIIESKDMTATLHRFLQIICSVSNSPLLMEVVNVK